MLNESDLWAIWLITSGRTDFVLCAMLEYNVPQSYAEQFYDRIIQELNEQNAND